MLEEPYLGILFGFILSLVSTLVSIVISNKISEKREIKKIKAEEEAKAINEIYSPLVFLLQRNRDFFVKILSLRGIFEKSPDKEDEPEINILLAIIFKNVYKYSNKFETFLYNKFGMIRPKEISLDLYLYYEYMDEMEHYCSSLKSLEIGALKEVIEFFVPILNILDEATERLREMAISRCANLDYTYKPFFTESVISNIEKELEFLHIKIFGSKKIDWKTVFDKDFKVD